jgi:hypothetical protein
MYTIGLSGNQELDRIGMLEMADGTGTRLEQLIGGD